MITKIISGGQTGADQAGLDTAVYLRLDTGGTIPKGRRTDSGPMSLYDFRRYKLIEHSSPLYLPRTECNVINSDGTVLFGDMQSPGSKATIRLLKDHAKPYIINPRPEDLSRWVKDKRISNSKCSR